MEAVTLGTLGEVLRRAGRLDEAATTLAESDRLFSALQLAEQHAAVLQSLVLVREGLGDLAEALATHRRFHALTLRLRAEAAEQQLQTLEARLRLERTEAELAQSVRRSDELAALNARLLEADRQREQLLAELQRLSVEDALTGLANRRALDQRLPVEVERARRHGLALCLAVLDVDRFKRINDEGSHGIGDAVLRVLAQLMRQHQRPTDLVARLGGDEMVLLLPQT